MSIGETQEVEWSASFTTAGKLLALNETRDPIRGAIRKATVDVEIDGNKTTLNCGNYHLPVVVGTVEVDCPVTGGYAGNNRRETGCQVGSVDRLGNKDAAGGVRRNGI